MNKKNEEKILLIASFLLQYPDDSWYESLEEIRMTVEEMSDEICSKPIIEFLKYARKNNILDIAELYVKTFDLSKETNLYLTYYSLQEKLERGEAMVRLKKRYEKAGFLMEINELPDFLPVVLEFASAAKEKDILIEYYTVLEGIFKNLSEYSNPYLHVLKSILLIAKEEGSEILNTRQLDKRIDYVSVGGVIV